MLIGARLAPACAAVIAVGLQAVALVGGAQAPSQCPLLFACLLLCCIPLVGAAPAASTGGGAHDGGTPPGMDPGALSLHALNARLLASDSAPPDVIDMDEDTSDTVLLIVVATLLQPLLLVGTCGRRVFGRRYTICYPR